jgi:hypothetical protein
MFDINLHHASSYAISALQSLQGVEFDREHLMPEEAARLMVQAH